MVLLAILNLLQNLKEFEVDLYGPDEIPNRLLKAWSVPMNWSFTKTTFQASINQSEVPAEWQHALVAPKGEHSLPSNYQPVLISLVFVEKSWNTQCTLK